MSVLEKLRAGNLPGRLNLRAVFGGPAAASLPLFLAPALAIWGLYVASHRAEVMDNLRARFEAENQYKVSQTGAWLEGIQREGRRLSRHPIFGGVLAEELASPGSRKAQLETWLKAHLVQKQYTSLAFRAPGGRIIAATAGFPEKMLAHVAADFSRAAAKCEARLGEMHIDPDGRPHMALMIPMSGRGDCAGGTVGVLVINIDPSVKLFPLLDARGVGQGPLRTLLVLRENGDAVLANVRGGGGAYGQRLPLDAPGLHAAEALAGRSEFFEALGLDGRRVLCSARQVPDWPWVVVTEMEKGAALRQARTQDYLALALLLLLALAGHTVFAAVLRAREKDAADALRRSEERLRETMEQAVDGILTGSAEGLITSLNRQMELIAGRSRQELLGRHVSALFSPEELARSPLRFDLLDAGQQVVLTRSVLRPDGTQVPVEMHSKRMSDGGYQSIYRDLTGRNEDRRKLEEAGRELRRSLAFTEALLSAVPTPVFYKDRGGRYLGCNKAFEDVMGVTPAQLKGKTVFELWPGEHAQTYHEKDLELMRNPARQIYDYRVRDKAGEERDVIYVKDVFRDADGEVAGIVGSFMDITQRKRAEEALRASEAKFRQFTECTAVGIFVVQDLKIVYANPSVAAIFGYAPGEVDGRLGPADLIHPEDQPLLLRRLGERLAGVPQSEVLPYRALKKDGSVITVEISGARFEFQGRPAVIGSVTDITARRAAEQALQASRDRLRSLWEHMAEGVALHDVLFDEAGNPVNYRLVEVNPQYLQILGLQRGDVEGRLATEVYGTSPAPYLEEFCGVAVTGEKRYLETYFPPMDRHFAISIAPWGKGGFATIFTDITARRRAELERQKLMAGLAEKTREMENVLYITTHDLRGPLVNIQGFSRNLEKYVADLKPLAEGAGPGAGRIFAKVPEALHFIYESSARMDGLIKALLKVSRLGRAEMHPELLDMRAVAERIAASVRFRLEESGGAVTVGELPHCWVDPSAADQVIGNLIDNAIKYRHPDRPPEIKISGEVRDGRAVYRVADNGCGLSARELGRIWDIFYRAESLPGVAGEGIGLTMARRLAEKNGGRLRAESEEGRGSVFILELPTEAEK